jgi:hypothetical protein
MGWHETEIAAVSHACTDIGDHGNVGRITLIDRDRCVLYYDVYPEMT